MSAPIVQPPPSIRTPTGLLAASTLCWIWAVLFGLAAFAAMFSAPVFGLEALIFALELTAAMVVSWVAGHLIRKRRKTGGWLGLIGAGLVAASQLYFSLVDRALDLEGLLTLAMSLAVVLLLLLNWRHLQRPHAHAAA